MPTAKRKATASPARSETNDDGEAALEIEQPLDDLIEDAVSSNHPAHLSSLQTLDSDLRDLDLGTLEAFLPSQKRRCLETLVGCLPPISSQVTEPVASNTLPSAEDQDAAVFQDTSSKNFDTDSRLRAAACVGLEEEWHNLHGMLHATVTSQESNSCLLIGAAGSGKSMLVDSVLESITAHVKSNTTAPVNADEKPYYHVHLAGTVQINDRQR